MELSELENLLIECWRKATDDEKEDVVFALRKHGMTFDERKDGTYPIYRFFALKSNR